MRKITTAVLLCAALVMLSGCGDKDNSDIQTVQAADTAEASESITESDTVTSEQAMSETTDLLVDMGKWSDDYKLICIGAEEISGQTHYSLNLATENEIAYQNVAAFRYNAENGRIYLVFDPTLDRNGPFAEFGKDIPEDDFRTQQIPLN